MNLYNNTLLCSSNRITPDTVINAEIDYYNPESMRPADDVASINKKLPAKLKISMQHQKSGTFIGDAGYALCISQNVEAVNERDVILHCSYKH